MIVMLPCLTVLADAIGIVGGYCVGTLAIGIRSALYIQNTINALLLKDIMSGLVKSVVFAGIIAMVGCYMAFVVEGGAEGVGKSTMISVVISLISIILADCLFTAIFYFFFKAMARRDSATFLVTEGTKGTKRANFTKVVKRKDGIR